MLLEVKNIAKVGSQQKSKSSQTAKKIFPENTKEISNLLMKTLTPEISIPLRGQFTLTTQDHKITLSRRRERKINCRTFTENTVSSCIKEGKRKSLSSSHTRTNRTKNNRLSVLVS